MSLNEFSWFAINILIPIFLPILGVIPFKMLPMPGTIEVRLIGLVKYGQWCWTAICIGTASLYELWDTNSQNLAQPESAEAFIFCIAALMVTAIGFASGGAVFKTQIIAGPLTLKNWYLNYQVLIGSFFVVSLISYFSFKVHFSILLLNQSIR
jgi:hypothetical protein